MFKHLLYIALFSFAPPLFATPLFSSQEFVLQNMEVDVTDESALEAQKKAFSTGELAAFKMLLQKMVSSEHLSKIPALAYEQSKNFITSFSVQDEKRSDIRYMATLQYRFDSTAIRNFLQNHAIPFSEHMVCPILIVPWIDPSHGQALQDLWRKAWEKIDLKKYTLPFVMSHPSSLSQEFSFGTNAAAEHLKTMAQKHKAPHVALMRVRGEPPMDAPTEESVESVLDVHPTALHNPDYTIQVTPSVSLKPTDLDRLIQIIHQGLVAIEKSHLTKTQGEKTSDKETIGLVLPTETLSQWHKNLQTIQTVPDLMIQSINSISKSTAHLMIQTSDRNQLAQELEKKGFHVDPHGDYLRLRMPHDTTKSA